MEPHVLVPIDDTPPATKAVEFAVSEYPTAKITILYVINIPDTDTYRLLSSEHPEDAGEEQQRRYEKAKKTVSSFEEVVDTHNGEIVTTIVAGVLEDTILDYTKDNNIDRIVIGLNKRGAIDRLLSTSVTEAVIRKAPIPVIVVKEN